MPVIEGNGHMTSRRIIPFKIFRKIYHNDYLFEIYKQWQEGKAPVNFDVDNLSEAFVVAVKLFTRFKRVEWRFSSSGRGLHFRVLDENGKPMFVDWKESLRIRAEIGDDPERIFWDIIKGMAGRPIGKLFDSKNGKKAGEWKELTPDSIVLIAKKCFEQAFNSEEYEKHNQK